MTGSIFLIAAAPSPKISSNTKKVQLKLIIREINLFLMDKFPLVCK
ncbi:hypothetical protein BRAS3843_2720029 [Bradyrhizobium sp. STM 3843]|nr:hypothetical protein BRAS3843_2720029 [Bradyrhizobium sp. STM 3843]